MRKATIIGLLIIMAVVILALGWQILSFPSWPTPVVHIPSPTPTTTPLPTARATGPRPTVPTATPVPRAPTATPVPPVLTATPVPHVPTATPVPRVPTATPVTPAPTATPLPKALRYKKLMAVLVYVPQSNVGPEGATGMVSLEVSSGHLEVQVEGLPPLEGQLYEGWLMQRESGAMLSTGKFNTDARGRGGYSITLGDQTGQGWDFFIITVEPEPDPHPDPSSDRSIGGSLRPGGAGIPAPYLT